MKPYVGFLIGLAAGAILGHLTLKQPEQPASEPAEWCFYAEYQSIEEMRYRLDQPKAYVRMNGRKPEVHIPCS